jgi:predicted Zn-dependent protease
MSQDKPRKSMLYRILLIISGVSFVGSTAFGLAGLFSGAFSQSNTKPTTSLEKNSQLQAQERGYELVLLREPENQIALEGLVQVRLQMHKPEEAVEPLEKLVKLRPERTDFKTQLEQLKRQVSNR